MAETNSYVRTDEHDVMRVGSTEVPIESVLVSFDQGHSPETIRQQYPSLTLEQVYGTIAYYLAHRDTVDAYLRRQDELWAKLRAESDQDASPVVQRLRSLSAARGAK